MYDLLVLEKSVFFSHTLLITRKSIIRINRATHQSVRFKVN